MRENLHNKFLRKLGKYNFYQDFNYPLVHLHQRFLGNETSVFSEFMVN